jgi:hypothetical protein
MTCLDLGVLGLLSVVSAPEQRRNSQSSSGLLLYGGTASPTEVGGLPPFHRGAVASSVEGGVSTLCALALNPDCLWNVGPGC